MVTHFGDPLWVTTDQNSRVGHHLNSHRHTCTFKLDQTNFHWVFRNQSSYNVLIILLTKSASFVSTILLLNNITIECYQSSYNVLIILLTKSASFVSTILLLNDITIECYQSSYNVLIILPSEVCFTIAIPPAEIQSI